MNTNVGTFSEANGLDRVGVVGSSLCAIHCFVSAFLPGLLTILGLGALQSSEAEWVFTLVTVMIASLALWTGFRRHGSRTVATLFLVGISCLLLSRAIEAGGEHHHAHSIVHEAHVEHVGSAVGEAHSSLGVERLHLWGTILGVFAGVTIVLGHLLSIRKLRCCENASCIVAARHKVSN